MGIGERCKGVRSGRSGAGISACEPAAGRELAMRLAGGSEGEGGTGEAGSGRAGAGERWSCTMGEGNASGNRVRARDADRA